MSAAPVPALVGRALRRQALARCCMREGNISPSTILVAKRKDGWGGGNRPSQATFNGEEFVFRFHRRRLVAECRHGNWRGGAGSASPPCQRTTGAPAFSCGQTAFGAVPSPARPQAPRLAVLGASTRSGRPSSRWPRARSSRGGEGEGSAVYAASTRYKESRFLPRVTPLAAGAVFPARSSRSPSSSRVG